jgi:hypothetical protein
MLPNGLYAVEMRTLDGVNAVATGVAVARDGVVMGGDPYFYYTGTYSCKDGRIKGEMVNRQHTPYHGTAQLFYAGREVGLGFSGTYEGDRAELYGVKRRKQERQRSPQDTEIGRRLIVEFQARLHQEK